MPEIFDILKNYTHLKDNIGYTPIHVLAHCHGKFKEVRDYLQEYLFIQDHNNWSVAHDLAKHTKELPENCLGLITHDGITVESLIK